MATVTPPLFLLCFFFIIISGGGILRIAKGQAPGQGAWCVAKPSSSDDELKNNIMFACSEMKDKSCDIIQPGGPCFEPQTLINQASVAMNLYYQDYGRHHWNCDFQNSGIISVTDPSYGECKYRYAQ